MSEIFQICLAFQFAPLIFCGVVGIGLIHLACSFALITFN